MFPTDEYPPLSDSRRRGRKERKTHSWGPKVTQKCLPTPAVHPALQEDQDDSSAHIMGLGQLQRCPQRGSDSSFQDDSSANIMDLIPVVLKDLIDGISSYSDNNVLVMSRTNSLMKYIGVSHEEVWWAAADRDKCSPALLDAANYHIYQFLCRYRPLEGLYAVNLSPGVEGEVGHLWTELAVLEIKFTSATSFCLSYWNQRSNFSAQQIQLDPFMEAELDSEQSVGDMLQLRPVGEECALSQQLGDSKKFYQRLTKMIQARDLVSIPMKTVEKVDPMYLLPDKQWPASLPRPGLYEAGYCGQIVRIVVYYNARQMIIKKVGEQHAKVFGPDFEVELSSAMVLTEEEQLDITKFQYVRISKGLDGNPKDFSTGFRALHLPQKINENASVCKAWYCPATPTIFHRYQWMVIVEDETQFIVLQARATFRFYKSNCI